MKTCAPDPDPAVLARLRHYAALCAGDLPQAKPARWAGVYLHGLLTDGDRTGIEPLSRRVALWPGSGWERGGCAGADPVWLLIGEQADGDIEYAPSNPPAETSTLRAARLWKSRWPVGQGYQQMEEELGLDHFGGRSWRGFRHHPAMVLPAYGLLLPGRERARGGRERAGGRRVPRRRGARAAADAPRHPAGVAAAAPTTVQARSRLLPITTRAPDPGVTE
jgi:SRSO17 transposase